MWTKSLLFLLLFTLAGCSWPANHAGARAALETLHSRLDRHEFHRVVETASARLTEGSDRETVAAFFHDVSQKLGPCQGATVSSERHQTGTSGTFVTLLVDRTCQQSNVREEIVWAIEQGEPKLAKYVYYSSARH